MAYTVGTEYFSNGYQPKTINGKALKETGKTVGQTYLKGSTSWNGKNMDSQKIWEAAGKQWVWVRTGDRTGYYVQYMPEYEYNRNNIYKGGIDFSSKNTTAANYTKRAASTNITSNPLTTPAQPPAQTNTNASGGGGTGASGSGGGGGGFRGTNTDTSTGGGGGSTSTVDPGLYDLINDIRAENKELQAKIEELSKPKYYTADELAEMHGVQDLYNEQKWLDDYNTATNKYYDEAVASQQDLRNAYAVNNGQYLDKTLESYMESYANQAPTATAKGATAANALSTMLGAGQTYANDDYSMLQTENLLEEQRKAELANNPNLARQQYNNIGMLLSQLGTDYYSSAVKEYVNQLDAYGNMYSSNRAAEGLANQGTAAKYNGLLQAAQNKASGVANSRNNFQDLWNLYYNTSGKNSNVADSVVSNLVMASTKPNRS
jgi:hypothetical protein